MFVVTLTYTKPLATIDDEVASYTLVEFRSSLHHPCLAPFADRGTRAIRLPEAP
jgi:hypothetical protein